MSPNAKSIVFILAAFLILISLVGVLWGFLSIVGSTDPVGGKSSWLGTGIFFCLTGLIAFAAGVGLIVWATRKKESPMETKVTLNIDLPGNVKMDTLKCQSCGGALKPDNISMVAGAPVVTCPYCNTTYQLTEEPKW